jgi:hypothetical protein
MNVHSSYMTFQGIAKRSYNRYKELDAKLMELAGKMTEEDIAKVDKYTFSDEDYERTDSMYTAIIFEAMAVEAYINWFGSVFLGYDSFQHFERVKTEDKILGVLKIVTGVDFIDNEAYKKVCYLFRIRNRLMHYKSIKMPETINEDRMDKFILKCYGDGDKTYEEIVHDVYGACKEFQQAIKKVQNWERTYELSNILTPGEVIDIIKDS